MNKHFVDVVSEMTKAAKSAFVYYTDARPSDEAEKFAELEAQILRIFGPVHESEAHTKFIEENRARREADEAGE